jgi:copper oxidase (laccase) domain-containing protein
VPEALEAALGELVLPCITPLPENRFQVDLKGIHRCCLEKAGVSAEKIVISDDCTACRPDIYWSHRKVGERRGVQCGLIALRD